MENADSPALAPEGNFSPLHEPIHGVTPALVARESPLDLIPPRPKRRCRLRSK
jgi:hypothetical protein